MKIFSVTSPKPGLGKTSLISGLSNILIRQGKNVKILNSIFSDSALSYELFPDDVVVSGNFKKNGSIIDDSDRIKEINKVVNSFENQTEYCFVESNFDSLEYNNSLVETLNSESILVIDYSKDIKSRLKQYKEKLFGIIINNVPKFRMNKIQDDLLNSIRKDGFKVIGIIPEDRCLLSCTIEQLSEHINGKFIYKNSSTNSLIENILIGGMVLDWSVHYFSSSFNVAAVIRGDRPDLQLGALQSGKVKVLILTKAMEPIEYVSYEAEKLGIPIILSEKNTEETVNLFENIHSKSNFNHPEKLQRITDLISTNCNMQLF